jgi:hypothetical protein
MYLVYQVCPPQYPVLPVQPKSKPLLHEEGRGFYLAVVTPCRIDEPMDVTRDRPVSTLARLQRPETGDRGALKLLAQKRDPGDLTHP